MAAGDCRGSRSTDRRGQRLASRVDRQGSEGRAVPMAPNTAPRRVTPAPHYVVTGHRESGTRRGCRGLMWSVCSAGRRAAASPLAAVAREGARPVGRVVCQSASSSGPASATRASPVAEHTAPAARPMRRTAASTPSHLSAKSAERCAARARSTAAPLA